MNVDILNNIFLTGFMGTGKSTVGRLLADTVGCRFVDLDALIVEQQGRAISEIFADEGEKHFRDCETKVLKSLSLQPTTVYATGGGIVMRDENRAVMKNLGQVVYLKTRWSSLKERLLLSTDRPLIDQKNDWQDVEGLLTKRQPFYEDADLVVDTDELQPFEVVTKIIAVL